MQDFPEHQYSAVIRPLVSSTNGTIVISGQFRGEGCWYFTDFFQAGQNKYLLERDGVTPLKDELGQPIENNLVKSWRIPSSEAVVYQGKMGKAELALMKRTMLQAVYEIECECIARPSIDAAFDAKQIRDCIRGAVDESYEPIRGQPYIIGLDLGYTVDHSVYLILEVHTGRVVKVHQFPLRTKAEEIAHEISVMSKKYNDAEVVIDVTGQGGAAGGKQENRRVEIITEAINARWHAEHINVPSKKEKYIVNIDIELQNNKLSIPPTERLLINELLSYEAHKSGSEYRYGSPKAQTSIHDDSVIALALALWGKKHNWYSDSDNNSGYVPAGY